MKKRKTSPASAQPPMVRFTLSCPTARQVTLAGSFNNWEAPGLNLAKVEGSSWEIEVALPAGSYEYRFIVDGSWQIDPNNPQKVPNPFGDWNSVVSVPAPGLPKGKS